jgi:hypothetical protein
MGGSLFPLVHENIFDKNATLPFRPIPPDIVLFAKILIQLIP